MKTRCLVRILLLALVLVACRAHPQPTSQPTPTADNEAGTNTPVRPTPTNSPLPQPDVSPLSPVPTPTDAASVAAVAYLAAELDIPPDKVAILSSESVQWSDTSLGCPKPGMMYAQVITPGYHFVLEAEGKEYQVHTDQTGNAIVICTLASEKWDGPEAAFQSLRTHLIQMYPGFGLARQTEWVSQDITTAGIVGSSTWSWRSGGWTVEMTFPLIPEPTYESVLLHQRAGTVWRGTMEADGRVNPAYDPPSLSLSVGACDQSITPDSAPEWAGVEITVRDGAIHLKQNLSYVCCAEIEVAIGQDGDVIRVIETNVGEVCRCMCGYPITARLSDLPAGEYIVEVWGVEYFDADALELLGSAEVTIP